MTPPTIKHGRLTLMNSFNSTCSTLSLLLVIFQGHSVKRRYPKNTNTVLRNGKKSTESELVVLVLSCFKIKLKERTKH